jgi:toxin YoeB
LEKHPREGKGQPEQLKHYEGEVWSRKINKKDRLVYEIYEKTICITIIQALCHYNDN